MTDLLFIIVMKALIFVMLCLMAYCQCLTVNSDRKHEGRERGMTWNNTQVTFMVQSVCCRSLINKDAPKLFFFRISFANSL